MDDKRQPIPAESANTLDNPPNYNYHAGDDKAHDNMPFGAALQQPNSPNYYAQPPHQGAQPQGQHYGPQATYPAAYPQQQPFYPPPNNVGYLPQDGPAPSLVLPIVAAVFITWMFGPLALFILCCVAHPRAKTAVVVTVGSMLVLQGVVALVAGRITNQNCKNLTQVQDPNGSNQCVYNGFGGSNVVGDCKTLCEDYTKFSLYFGIVWIVFGVLIALVAVLMARRRKV
ncbi:hypothetical protein HDU86_006250 [Geranomyces michiganensis]|nr:hypothetical protein HDU86_006250 [Geranomyces michiganensis]